MLVTKWHWATGFKGGIVPISYLPFSAKLCAKMFSMPVEPNSHHQSSPLYIGYPLYWSVYLVLVHFPSCNLKPSIGRSQWYVFYVSIYCIELWLGSYCCRWVVKLYLKCWHWWQTYAAEWDMMKKCNDFEKAPYKTLKKKNDIFNIRKRHELF